MKTTALVLLTILMSCTNPTAPTRVENCDSIKNKNKELESVSKLWEINYLTLLISRDSLLAIPPKIIRDTFIRVTHHFDTVIKFVHVVRIDTVHIPCDTIPPIVVNPDEPFKIVWSENFDAVTSTQPWKYYSKGWWDPRNTLQTVEGHGKVLRVYHGAGDVGSSSGLGNYRIPLDKGYKDLWFSWDYYVPGDFDLFRGGKFFGGFAGGTSTAIPNNDKTDTDGWCTMFLFNENVNYSSYNYFKGTSYNSDGWPYGTHIANIVKGRWNNITIRMVVNDGDKSNGIYEVFDNGKLVFQQTDAKIVNQSHPDYLIQYLYLNHFFGGGNATYASPKNQWIHLDNWIAWTDGSVTGASKSDRVITVPKAFSFHPVPPNRFIERVYNAESGTIKSHEDFDIAVEVASKFQTSTIYVPYATSLTLNVNDFKYEGGINYIGYKQILRIYSGTGSNKTLLRTFMNGVYTTVPTTIAITGNSATIEWQNGSGDGGKWTINYTSR